MAGRRDCRVYIGNLPPDIRQRDLEDLFYKYGHINFIDVKLTRGAPFAFIEFDDPRFVFCCIKWKYWYIGTVECSNSSAQPAYF